MSEVIKSIQLDGNNNVVIQSVQGSQITVNTLAWEDFVSKYTLEKQQRIEELQKLLERSEELFNYKRLELSGQINSLQAEKEQTEKQLKEIIARYEGQDISQTSHLYQKAFQNFLEGKLDKALDELDEAHLDEDLRQNAEARVLKANILELQYHFEEAEKNLTRAVELYPNWGNFLSMANFLQRLNRLTEAEFYYQRSLALANAPVTRASTLNNLANLQKDKNEFKAAELAYKEALKICKELTNINPEIYLPYAATTLNNLAVLQQTENKFELAEATYEEALKIRRELAKVNPQTYLPDLAMTLNNLAVLHWRKNEFEVAHLIYDESLKIYRELAKSNPQTYSSKVAMTLNNLGNLHSAKNEFEAAESIYEEALKIRRELAKVNPQAYLSEMAMTLNNLGNLRKIRNESEAAESNYYEVLSIYRELAKSKNWPKSIHKLTCPTWPRR